MNTEDYQRALELTEEYLPEPVGYSRHNSTTPTDKQIIRQNNTIICLQEIIISKLNYIIKKSDNPLIPPPIAPIRNAYVADIISRLDKIDLGEAPVKKKVVNFKDKNPLFGIRK